LGALGTGTLEGAIRTGTVAASAPKINDFQNSVAQDLTHMGMSEKAAEAVASGLTSLSLASAGVAAGLNTGSTATAINVDSNNRQLHVDEAKVLKKLTEGKSKQEQDRLRAAACALVKCSEGVPESDVNYKGLKAFEALGETYTKEKNALKATGLFTYSNWDKANDIRTNHDEAVTRVGGAGKVITGGVTAIGGSAAGAGLCTTGLGCAVGAPLTGVSVVGGVSTAIEGKNQIFGGYTSQEGKKVIDSYNPNRKQELSQLSQDALNGAVAVAEAVLLGKVGGKLSQGAKSEVKTSEKVVDKEINKQTKPPLQSQGLPPPKQSQMLNMQYMEEHEVQQVQSILNLRGGIFEGTPTKRYPAIDGWLNGVPVQLKEVTGNSINAIQKNILKADTSLKKHGYKQAEVYVDASKTGISRDQLNDFIKTGSPISNILNEGAVKSIYVNTKDGWLIINRANFIK